MAQKVLLGMSGGVDSSMAVKLLQNIGYEVVGATFNVFKDERNEKVAEIADKLNIEHNFIDIHKNFDDVVVSYFLEEYKSGRTPSPCVFCNENIKFPVLLAKAEELGIDLIATGHYVNKVMHNGKYFITKGADEKKDQSYYLWRLKQDILARTIFPLGMMMKDFVKNFAGENSFTDLQNQKESMGVCFLKNTNYRDFLIERLSDIETYKKEGDVKDTLGNIVGKHTGFINYTIGQKKGLDLNIKGDFYVCKIDNEKNELTIDEKENIKSQVIHIVNYFFNDINDLQSNEIYVKVRGIGLNPEGFSKIEIVDDEKATIYLESPAWAIASGQPIVCYIKNRVIGGGFVL